jgi:hypothetical protein
VSVEALKLSLPLSLPLLLLYIPALGKQANNPTTWIDGWMDGCGDGMDFQAHLYFACGHRMSE